MTKYIDADKLKSHYSWFDENAEFTKHDIDDIVDAQPAADVVEVAHWDEREDEMYCPKCGQAWNYCDNDTERFNFCPHCGADMRKEDDHAEKNS